MRRAHFSLPRVELPSAELSYSVPFFSSSPPFTPSRVFFRASLFSRSLLHFFRLRFHPFTHACAPLPISSPASPSWAASATRLSPRGVSSQLLAPKHLLARVRSALVRVGRHICDSPARRHSNDAFEPFSVFPPFRCFPVFSLFLSCPLSSSAPSSLVFSVACVTFASSRLAFFYRTCHLLSAAQHLHRAPLITRRCFFFFPENSNSHPSSLSSAFLSRFTFLSPFPRLLHHLYHTHSSTYVLEHALRAADPADRHEARGGALPASHRRFVQRPIAQTAIHRSLRRLAAVLQLLAARMFSKQQLKNFAPKRQATQARRPARRAGTDRARTARRSGLAFSRRRLTRTLFDLHAGYVRRRRARECGRLRDGGATKKRREKGRVGRGSFGKKGGRGGESFWPNEAETRRARAPDPQTRLFRVDAGAIEGLTASWLSTRSATLASWPDRSPSAML